MTGQTGWRIDSDSKADWALRKIAEAEEEYNRLAELADQRIAELKARKDAEATRRDNAVEPLKAALQEYFQTVKPSTDTKTQTTYRLLSGTLVQKKPSVKMSMDSDKLAEWLMSEGREEYLKVSPVWGELKKKLVATGGGAAFADTGEMVEGVTSEEVPGEFQIKGAKR
ncbi:MAG: host-nuclease inhibitor Gam family protein [Clostridiales bacterium]|nr:host-nuclease inhibitor Gam family protein [Clostridiales bacterium]